MSRRAIFLGPSLDRATAERILPTGPATRYLPPARQGDLVACVEDGASTVLLVDGLFHGPPSVWHREILWAVDRGVRVLGAASMGALRAAECAAFGMEPVGAIAEGYRTGRFEGCWDASFEDDDEVAVLHGPAETGFVALSTAMVDLRARLAETVREGVLALAPARALAASMKRLPFGERSWAALADAARQLGEVSLAASLGGALGAVPGQTRPGIQMAVKAGAKAADARLALELLASDAPAPARPDFRFEQALVWTRRERVKPEPSALVPGEAVALLKAALEPDGFRDAGTRALALLLADGPPAEPRAALDRFRRRRALWTRPALDDWAARAGLDGPSLLALAVREASLDRLLDDPPPGFAAALRDTLRLDGRAFSDASTPAAEATEAEAAQALAWFVEAALGGIVSADREALARRFGFADAQALGRGAAELRRRRLAAGPGSAGGMSGTRIRLFPQAEAGYVQPETVILSVPAGGVGPGPRDADLVTVMPVGKRAPYAPPGFLPPWRGPALAPAMPDAAGHFDRIPIDLPQFRAAHLYGGVRFTLDVWERYLGRPVRWHADWFPTLELVAFVDWNNAQSGPGFIETGWRAPADGVPRLFALNFDVIAHEVGHAVLFSELGAPPPDQLHGEFLAFHESWSDLVALIAALHFHSVRDRLLTQSEGDLYVLNHLNRIGEISPTEQIRFAANTEHMAEFDGVQLGPGGDWIDPRGLGRKAHHLSAPLTGAVFDCLVELYQDGLARRGAITADDDARGWTPAEVATSLVRRGGATRHRFQPFRPAFEASLDDARDLVGIAMAAVMLQLDPLECRFDRAAGLFVDALLRCAGPANRLAFRGHFENHGIRPASPVPVVSHAAWRALPYAERVRRVRAAQRGRAGPDGCRAPCAGHVLAAGSFLAHEDRIGAA